MAAKKKETTVDILRVDTEEITINVVGMTPMLCNAMSAKARRDLITPPPAKNKAAKATMAKHNPPEEYRRSVYRFSRDDRPTRIYFPGGGIKRAIAQAAIDIPGARKSEIGRLAHVIENDVCVFGVPQLHMAVVRQAGVARTPDVRTRAIIPEWAMTFTVRYIRPNLSSQNIADLVASAGLIVGLGDGRPEKGALSFGQFQVVPENDETFQRIVSNGGREAQDDALEHFEFYDIEAEELFEFWQEDVTSRGLKLA